MEEPEANSSGTQENNSLIERAVRSFVDILSNAQPKMEVSSLPQAHQRSAITTTRGDMQRNLTQNSSRKVRWRNNMKLMLKIKSSVPVQFVVTSILQISCPIMPVHVVKVHLRIYQVHQAVQTELDHIAVRKNMTAFQLLTLMLREWAWTHMKRQQPSSKDIFCRKMRWNPQSGQAWTSGRTKNPKSGKYLPSTKAHKLTGHALYGVLYKVMQLLELGESRTATSQILVESNLFVVAGRMIGHCFLHGGPGLHGVSEAIIHMLLHGDVDTATIYLADVADLDLRETIHMLDGDELLSDQQTNEINNLAFSWDLPAIKPANRRWLFQQLMQHAVIGRRTKQIKQIRKGLKDTKVWTLLKEKPETARIVFPRQANAFPTAQAILSLIVWPRDDSDDDEDDSYPRSIQDQTAGFLRKFIETEEFASGSSMLTPASTLQVAQ
ncbi:G2/M phase-specific E3 ubiquitin-protein ligase, partial [Dissostichus eleginoides]